jgi:hypothetical protein
MYVKSLDERVMSGVDKFIMMLLLYGEPHLKIP